MENLNKLNNLNNLNKLDEPNKLNMEKLNKGQVLFRKELPSLSLPLHENSLLIYDQKLSIYHPQLANWLAQFEVTYPVSAGEHLKSLDIFPEHCKKISFLLEKQGQKKQKGQGQKGVRFIALGGGSVCDFTGFLASIFHRGTCNELIYIPSTLLAAADAAHGGKTALNVSSYKNQLGTFFSAHKIYIVSKLLQSQNPQQETEGFVEMAKIALLTNPSLWAQMQKKNITPYPFLKKCILEKQRIVHADFKEEKNLRPILNYGHTLGHALESSCSMSHGQAVFYGMCFSLQLGIYLKCMSQKESHKILHSPLFSIFLEKITYKGKWPSSQQIESALQRDKKREGFQFVQFIFLKKIGQPLIKTVSIQHILQGYERECLTGPSLF